MKNNFTNRNKWALFLGLTCVMSVNSCAQKNDLTRADDTMPTLESNQSPSTTEVQPSSLQSTVVSKKSAATRASKKTNKPSQQRKSAADSSQSATTTVRSIHPSIPLNSPFKLKYGQKRSLPNSELNFKISKVSDSRCPLEMQCAQSGGVVITLLFYRDNTRIDTINVDENNDKIPLIKDRQFAYRLRLLELQPYPTVQFIEPQHYVAEFIVTQSSLE